MLNFKNRFISAILIAFYLMEIHSLVFKNPRNSNIFLLINFTDRLYRRRYVEDGWSF